MKLNILAAIFTLFLGMADISGAYSCSLSSLQKPCCKEKAEGCQKEKDCCSKDKSCCKEKKECCQKQSGGKGNKKKDCCKSQGKESKKCCTKDSTDASGHQDNK